MNGRATSAKKSAEADSGGIKVLKQRLQSALPTWSLDRISVRSARYGVSKEAVYNMDIDSIAKFTKPLV